MITNIDKDFEDEVRCINVNNINRILVQIKNKGGLSKEETFILFKLLHKDKEKGVPLENSVARTILIMAYDRFIIYIMNKNNFFGEDLYTIGKIGLIKAVDSYDISKEVLFMSYAAHCIKNEILMFLRKENSSGLFNGRVCSIDSAINDKDEEFSLYEIIPSEENVSSEVADNDEVNNILKLFCYLSPIEQYCILATTGLYGKPQKQSQVAKQTGLSQPYISRIVGSASNKLYILASTNRTPDQEKKLKDLMSVNYSVMTAEEFLNYKFDRKESKINLISKDIERRAEIEEISEKSLKISSEPLSEKDKYISILKFLKPLEQVCVIFRFGLYGQRLWTCAEIAKKINWKKESLLHIYKEALKKADLLVKDKSSLSEEEEKLLIELTKVDFKVIKKEDFKFLGKFGKNSFVT